MPDKYLEKKHLLPQGYVFLGQGPLKKKHFEERGDNLLIWGEDTKQWRLIDCQGSDKAFYAAKENSQAHLSNANS